GQGYYGGYDLGPDYGAMLQQALAQQNAMVRAAEQRAEQAIDRAMHDPRCKAMYQQHLAQGGRTSFRDFAYWYVATSGGDPTATRRYVESERQNQQKEMAAWQGLQQAQENRRRAMANWQASFGENQRELGNILNGQATYLDSHGARQVLPYLQPGFYRNPANGNLYHLDSFGRYHLRYLNGVWWELTPDR
ncbi:MAG TPA: hypothetical protein PKD72_11710, partial [Gemmatales bacterium]|nr:hypothetical protein [Gemmatales bacterium]